MKDERRPGPGRPPRNDVAASRRINVMVTDIEHAQIAQKAAERGMTVADLVRSAVLAPVKVTA